MDKYVKVPLEAYMSMAEDGLKLMLLEDAGVDNWVGYGEALEDYADCLEEDIIHDIIEE